MVAWYWLIVVFITGLYVGVLCEEWVGDFVANSIVFLYQVVVFIPLALWYFFRNLFKAIPAETWEEVISNKRIQERTIFYPLFGNIYLGHDLKASTPYHKFFLLRRRKT